jgi:hypothetical protein
VKRDALIPALRSTPLLALGVAMAASVAVVAARHGEAAATPIQVVSVLLAAAIGFCLDDPAHEVMEASPASLFRRRLLRVALVAPPTVATWTVLTWWQRPASADEVLALVLLFAGLLALSLAVAGVAGRTSSAAGRGGMAAPPALLGAILVSSLMRPRWRPLPFGDIPGGWSQIHLRWGLVAAAGTVAFLVSCRDPAAGHRIVRSRR